MFFDLNLCISNDTVSTKIYNKWDDFDLDIVNSPFLDGDVPRRTSYRVYISQLIRFARASSDLTDFNCRSKALTAKPLRKGYRYFKFRKAFSKFYRRPLRKTLTIGLGLGVLSLAWPAVVQLLVFIYSVTQ